MAAAGAARHAHKHSHHDHHHLVAAAATGRPAGRRPLGNGVTLHPYQPLAVTGLDLEADQRPLGLQPEHSEALGDGLRTRSRPGDRRGAAGADDPFRSGRPLAGIAHVNIDCYP